MNEKPKDQELFKTFHFHRVSLYDEVEVIDSYTFISVKDMFDFIEEALKRDCFKSVIIREEDF